MTIKTISLMKAGAATTAILWTFCSALVFIAPDLTMNMTGHMIHYDLHDVSWTLTISGYLLGLIAWSLSAAIILGFFGALYNALSDKPSA